MEDMIFIVLFIAIPVTILTMGFIAMISRQERELDEQTEAEEGGPPRQL